MRVHGIVDYSYLYYRYKLILDSGKMSRLSSTVEENGVLVNRDVSKIYYSIKDIEGFVKKLESAGHEVIMSICFDMPTKRKEASEGASEGEIQAAKNYKSNRTTRLGELDFENIRIVEELLKGAGYNTYRFEEGEDSEGLEADDIVNNLIRYYKDEFDYNIIYTPDSDLLVNICDNVGAMRYKSMRGYTNVNRGNFEEYISKEFKCRVPYNALMLYKCTCGDKADNIAGIVRFGPKAFDKLVNHIESNFDIDWSEYGNFEKTEELLDMCCGYLNEDQIRQAKESLDKVKPIDVKFIEKPTSKSTTELREKSYMRYNMKSLVR